MLEAGWQETGRQAAISPPLPPFSHSHTAVTDPITPDTAPLPPGVRLLPLNDAPPEARALLFPYHMGRQWRLCVGMLLFAAFSLPLALHGSEGRGGPFRFVDPHVMGWFAFLFCLGLAAWSFRANLRPRFLAAASDGVVLCRSGGGDLLPWDALEGFSVEEVQGPGGRTTVIGIRLRPEERDRFLPRLRKEMEWNREMYGPDLALTAQLFQAPPELIVATLAHYLRHPAERERLGPSGMPRIVFYTPGETKGEPGRWREPGKTANPFAHGPKLEEFRQQLLRGETEMTVERLREVIGDLEPDPMFSPPELCYFENCAAPWMEVARPEWLPLVRELLVNRPRMDPEVRAQVWLFAAELGERFPAELVQTFAPLLTRPAGQVTEPGRVVALELLGGSGREEAVEYLAPLVGQLMTEAELEALALALATLRFPRSRALLEELRETPAWKARPRPELEEQLDTILAWTPVNDHEPV